MFYVLRVTLNIFRWAACLQPEIPTGVQLLPDYHQAWSLTRDLTVHIPVSLAHSELTK